MAMERERKGHKHERQGLVAMAGERKPGTANVEKTLVR